MRRNSSKNWFRHLSTPGRPGPGLRPKRTKRPATILPAILLACAGAACLAGCAKTPEYGTEVPLMMPGGKAQVWAIAPAINLSGQREVDPLLQSDILYQQLQEVRGLTVIPVDRVVEAYAGLKIKKVESPEDASRVCEALGCGGLVVPTVTAFDPYDPPKFGGSLVVFHRGTQRKEPYFDPHDLDRAAAAPAIEPPASIAGDANVQQAVGMFDANNGSVRDALFGYARGRNDPLGAMGEREYLMCMDRYVAFAYHTLIEQVLRSAGQPSKISLGSVDVSSGAGQSSARVAGKPARDTVGPTGD